MITRLRKRERELNYFRVNLVQPETHRVHTLYTTTLTNATELSAALSLLKNCRFVGNEGCL